MTQRINEYTHAFFSLACETKNEDSYRLILKDILLLFEENPDYLRLLSSPSIPIQERLTVLDKVFFPTLPDEVLSFLKILCENRLISHIKSIEQYYTSLFEELFHISSARVFTAIALDNAQKSALRIALEKKLGHRIVLDCRIEPMIIGGIRVEVDGMVMDESLRLKVKDVISL